MSEYVRVCRECGEEYRAGVARCSDCGGELQDLQLDEDGYPVAADEEPSEAAAEPAPPVERRLLFVTSQATELEEKARALGESGIEYHVAEQPGTAKGAPGSYALLVAEADAAEALRTLAALLDEEQSDELHALETRFQDGRYVACPACGAEQSAGTVECRECGLVFGAEAENAAFCSRCGNPLPKVGAACVVCPPD
ncbi:MAG TPA: hypothetical protein VEQ10_12315 [Vicinamibacteria bacterium]|nr:hypothetical protein [Vicinamibacteria bacterium]